MVRWARGEQTVQFLVSRNRLEGFEAEDLAALTETLIGRAVLRVETTAAAALAGGDVDGAFVAAYDGYRMTAEALLARQALRATGGDGSHMAVEDAVSATSTRSRQSWSRAETQSHKALPLLPSTTSSSRVARSGRPLT